MQAPTPPASTSSASSAAAPRLQTPTQPAAGPTALADLRALVSSGDFGATPYSLDKVQARIGASLDRYVDSGFSWDFAVQSQAPALLFRDASNQVAGFRGRKTLPTDDEHLLSSLEGQSVLEIIQQAVDRAGPECPPDQCSVDLPRYYSKIKIKQEEGYIYPPEFWLQAGNRESANHVDHGQVISYIPPCATACFKIWVFFPPNLRPRFKWGNKVDSFNRMLHTTGSCVLVQRPGGVVYLNSLVYHSVLLGYLKNTPPSKKWGAIFGDVIVLEQDRPQSYKYATQLASGAEHGSPGAWTSLLSAYCVMEGRAWEDENYEEEKKIFMAKLPQNKSTTLARSLAKEKWGKKRSMSEKMKALREKKKVKAGGTSE